jgi:hypothetical protein
LVFAKLYVRAPGAAFLIVHPPLPSKSPFVTTLDGVEGVGAGGGVEVVVVVYVEVEVSEVKMDVVHMEVEMLVSITVSVTTSVAVVVVLETGAVVTDRVTVEGCGFKQLHALESFEAGRRAKFLRFSVGQLDAALVVRLTTAAPNTVSVTVTCTTSLLVRVVVVPVVVVLYSAC